MLFGMSSYLRKRKARLFLIIYIHKDKVKPHFSSTMDSETSQHLFDLSLLKLHGPSRCSTKVKHVFYPPQVWVHRLVSISNNINSLCIFIFEKVLKLQNVKN